MSRALGTVSWPLRVIAAAILRQTLYFKFTGAPESVFIWTTLGLEPWGRIGTGVVELIASALLLIPGTALYGAILSLGVSRGAIFSHLTRLGTALTGNCLRGPSRRSLAPSRCLSYTGRNCRRQRDVAAGRFDEAIIGLAAGYEFRALLLRATSTSTIVMAIG